MVATFMALIMTRKLSALTALIIIPTLFALALGYGNGLGPMMLEGVKQLAPTGVMLIFAILYFGIMIDVGLFDPLVRLVVRIVHGDPVRIAIGTAVLALVVSLDGDGATTYMITTSAMLPLYRHMKMDVRMMACLIIMSGAVMNVLPWGGPTARVATALDLDPGTLFVPLIPAMALTACWVIFVAWRFGLHERKRLALAESDLVMEDAEEVIAEDPEFDAEARRPKLMWFNFMLTLALMTALVLGALPLAVLFMLAFAVALVVNYRSIDEQRERIRDHADNALAVASLIFAAGVFTGILEGTKMVDAMANSVTAMLPPAVGPYMAPVTALLSAPFTYFMSNDAFYFGVLPILAESGSGYGIAVDAIGRASLVGQQVHLLSPLVASTYLLVSLSNIEFGEHQRFSLKWACGSFAVFFAGCVLTGAFPVAVFAG